jgi:hypothetical protein
MAARASRRNLAGGTPRHARWGAVAVASAFVAYGLLAWDGFVTNFQARWMCDEDRGFVLLRRANVMAVAIPGPMARRDARLLPAFEQAYPLVVVEPAAGVERPAYALDERWPKRVRDYWGYAVVRTELNVLDRADRNRALGSTSLYERIERGPEGLRLLRAWLVPPAERCTPADRVEFVKRVLAPP